MSQSGDPTSYKLRDRRVCVLLLTVMSGTDPHTVGRQHLKETYYAFPPLLCFIEVLVHVKGPHRRELLSPTENTLLKRLVNSPIFALHPVCQHVTHLHSLRLYSQ